MIDSEAELKDGFTDAHDVSVYGAPDEEYEMASGAPTMSVCMVNRMRPTEAKSGGQVSAQSEGNGTRGCAQLCDDYAYSTPAYSCYGCCYDDYCTAVTTICVIMGTKSEGQEDEGICGFGDRCWNQHGDTFDNAVALAIQTQQGLRRHVAPFLYDPADGGTIRQIDRDEARRVICATILRYRMSTIRKWYFGTSWTTYYEYQSFARSDLARQLRVAVVPPRPAEQILEFRPDLVCDPTSHENGSTIYTTVLRCSQHGNGI
ncbi:unnamed protein product [Symbiodinium microadriaticum]|nr:unnamed protein product [Symbiodinium microadriaticum]